jgi:hypothetical protein
MGKKHCEKCGTDNLLLAKYCRECGYELPKYAVEEPAQIPDSKPQKQKKPLALIIGMVVGVILAANVPTMISKYYSKNKLIDKVLIEYASEYNKSLPMMLDADTRLDNIIAMPNKTVMYNYTIVSADIQQYMPDTLTIKEYMIPRCINISKTNPDMEMFRNNEITQRYTYMDKNGAYIFSFTITPDQIK